MQPTRLARRIHDGPIQRLCGVAAALAAPVPLNGGVRQRCRVEVDAAIADLRALISEEVTEVSEDAPRTVAAAVRNACAEDAGADIEIRLDGDATLPVELAELVQDFVGEAIRNARKHARPERITVRAVADETGARVEVQNDGVGVAGSVPSTGLGIQLLRDDVFHYGGVVDSRAEAGGRWTATLSLPPDASRRRARRFEPGRAPRVTDS